MRSRISAGVATCGSSGDAPTARSVATDRRGSGRARGGRRRLRRRPRSGARALERGAQDPRDLHLRDPDVLADLALREVLDEAQVQDAMLARREPAHAARHRVAALDERDRPVLAADRLAERARLAVGAAGGVLERRRPRRGGELEAGEDVLDAQAAVVGELLRRRRAAVARGQLLDRSGEGEHALLVAAGHLHRPRVVAVVALQLADDGRDRVRGELATALGVEALDRAQQADARDLDEVVERLGAAAVAARQAAGERHEALDELVAGGEVAEARVAAEQALDARTARLGGAGQRVPARRRPDSGLSGDGDRPPGDERGTAGCSPAGLGPVPRGITRVGGGACARVQAPSDASSSSTTSISGRRAPRASERMRSNASRSPRSWRSMRMPFARSILAWRSKACSSWANWR